MKSALEGEIWNEIRLLVYAEGRIEEVWKFGDNVEILNIG